MLCLRTATANPEAGPAWNTRRLSEGPGTNEALQKYQRRGWQAIARLTPAFLRSRSFANSFRVGQRWVNDRQAWRLPLDTTGLDAVHAPADLGVPDDFDSLIHNNFELAYHHNGRVTLEWEFDSRNTTAVQFPYVLSPKFQEYFWLEVPNATDDANDPYWSV